MGDFADNILKIPNLAEIDIDIFFRMNIFIWHTNNNNTYGENVIRIEECEWLLSSDSPIRH